MNAPRVTTIILAAGASTRLGHPKQLVPFRGTPLLAHAARTALDAALGPVIVVLGADAGAIAPVLTGLDLAVVTCRAWADGIGRSIAAGVERAARDPSCAATILMTCDQPEVSADHLRRLAATWQERGAPTVASSYGGTTGVPALFARSAFARLGALPPSAGAKSLLQGAPSVPCDACGRDIDTAEDVAELDASTQQERPR